MGVSVSQKGNVLEPAKVESVSTVDSLPLPKGSVLSVVEATSTAPQKTEVVLSNNSVLKLERHSEIISAPKTFPPEVGPSAIEIATAKGVELSYWLAGGLLLLCAGLAYTGHFKAAIISGSCAVVVPILARFVSEVSALAVFGFGFLVSVTLYFAWYLMQNHPEILARVKTEVSTVEAKVVSGVTKSPV